MHRFTQVLTELVHRQEILESEELIVVEYHNEKCYHSTYAVMQINVNQWIMPEVIETCPTLDSIDNVLESIQRGRALATKLQLTGFLDGKKLLLLGSVAYNLIDEIVSGEYQ